VEKCEVFKFKPGGSNCIRNYDKNRMSFILGKTTNIYAKLEYKYYAKYFFCESVHFIYADKYVLLPVPLPRQHSCKALLISYGRAFQPWPGDLIYLALGPWEHVCDPSASINYRDLLE
jgi:hypothetical protein